jgi:hypothetical protein
MKLSSLAGIVTGRAAPPQDDRRDYMRDYAPEVAQRGKEGRSWRRQLKLNSLRLAVFGLLALGVGLGGYWSREPALLEFTASAEDPIGVQCASALVRVGETLLDKPGGYLSNDITPPSILLDNIPNWEFGLIVQLRDYVRAMRNDFTRSQSQSTEDVDLAGADPHFSFDNESWIFPSTESEYREGIKGTQRYLSRLRDQSSTNPARFYPRADNLRIYLETVGKRLGDQAQRLSNSVGRAPIVQDLHGNASVVLTADVELEDATPWMQLDDVFYEARGATWAIENFLRAISIDFRSILENKNATMSLQQVIRELGQAQGAVSSPLILNGHGYRLFANHSLILASYISRANAALIDLRALLTQG